MSKFCYEENELKIAECQCEWCVHYNDGNRSEVCPSDLLEKIINNEILCPKMKQKSVLDLFSNDKKK